MIQLSYFQRKVRGSLSACSERIHTNLKLYKNTLNKHKGLLSNRIRKLMYIFKNLRHVADKSVIKMPCLALCQSLLSFCISSWGGTENTHMLKLERAQRAVLKVAYSFLFFLIQLLNYTLKLM